MSMREKIARAVNDPGKHTGFRGERTLGEWQADAVLALLKEHGEEAVEGVALALYERNPKYDQEVDLDGVPITAPYRVTWNQLAEYDGGHREDLFEDARVAINAFLAAAEKP